MQVDSHVERCKVDGKFDAYAFPGGYPIYYVTKDCGVLCPACCNGNIELTNDKDDAQWYVVASDINYEDECMYCENCNMQIESAYDND